MLLICTYTLFAHLSFYFRLSLVVAVQMQTCEVWDLLDTKRERAPSFFFYHCSLLVCPLSLPVQESCHMTKSGYLTVCYLALYHTNTDQHQPYSRLASENPRTFPTVELERGATFTPLLRAVIDLLCRGERGATISVAFHVNDLSCLCTMVCFSLVLFDHNPTL